MKAIKMKIKANDKKLRNEFHFDVQRTTRAAIYKPKKGKGSFKRKKRVEEDYD